MADTDKLVKVGQLDAVADAVIEVVSDTNERLDGLGDGVPTEVRQALLTLLQSAAYAETGLTDEVAVIASWAAIVTAISLNQSSISINGANTSQLVATTTPTGGAVTWASSDTSVATVSSNGLVTGIGNGTATITASCGDKKATCSVTVSGFATLTGITATYTQSGTVYNTDTLDSLKSDLVVTAAYSDSTTRTLSDSDYTLSGTLEVGTSAITVSYGGETTTFNVTVSDSTVITPTYTQGNFSTGTSDTNRVSAVITQPIHLDDDEVLVITIPSGYSLFPYKINANSNSSLAGTASGSNTLYSYCVSDSGYISNKNSDIGGVVNAVYINMNTGAQMTQTLTSLSGGSFISYNTEIKYVFNRNGNYGYTFTGLGFVIKKDDNSDITPSMIEQVVSIQKAEASS